MGIDKKDFLNSAREMLENGVEAEITYRNATSRAYYSAYHRVKDLEGLFPESSERKGCHQKLINTLLATTTSEHPEAALIKATGVKLMAARDARTAADYYLDEDVSKANAQKAIAEAETLIQRAEKILSTSVDQAS